MKIERNMDVYGLAERMGSLATWAEAETMRDLLLESGYRDTGDIPEDEWLEMLEAAVRRTAELNGV